jgi:hypothetical protein
MRRNYQRDVISLEKMNASVQGWIAHAQHGQTWGLRRALLGRAIVQASR